MTPLFWTRVIGYAVLVLTLIGIGAAGAAKYYGPKLRALQSEFDTFRGGVEALGKAAQERKRVTELANQRHKEKVDAENKRNSDILRADLKRLRDERDRARGSFVPQPAAGSRSTETACFARAELESAIGRLVGQLRGITQEGDQSALDLKTAREWAAGR